MISIDMTKAKDIAHDKRRAARSAEFAPLDIKATIPAEATAAEEARQAIREKYATLQAQMDAAQTADELKALLPKE
jgi:predicted  nucleic acid-binding Zn-ribbon protein